MIVLEGCDCAGKTSLARELMREIGGKLAHFERYGLLPNWWDYSWMYVNSCRDWAVVDRFIVSEFVYGRLWRNGPNKRLDPGALDVVRHGMAAVDAITVYVRPPIDVVLQRMETRGEKLLKKTEVSRVYSMYDEYLLGSICKITDTPVIVVTGLNSLADVSEILVSYRPR